jgi:hypothetical protein
MSGSEADPVRLDPFTRITEVGWNIWTHLCFEIQISVVNGGSVSNVPTDPKPGPPGYIPIPEADYNAENGFLVIGRDANQEYATGYSETTIDWGAEVTTIYGWKKTNSVEEEDNWTTINSGFEIVGGLPSIGQTGGYAINEAGGVCQALGFGPFPQSGFDETQTPEEDLEGMYIPNDPSKPFNWGPSQSWKLGTSGRYDGDFFWGGYASTAYDWGSYHHKEINYYIDATIDGTAITVKYKGQTFRGIGFRATGFTKGFLLLKRVNLPEE